MKILLLLIVLSFELLSKDSRINQPQTANYFGSYSDKEWRSTNFSLIPSENFPSGLLILNKKSNSFNRIWFLAHLEVGGVLAYTPVQYQELNGPKITEQETLSLISELSYFNSIQNTKSSGTKKIQSTCCGNFSGSIKILKDESGQDLMITSFSDEIPIFGMIEYTNLENNIPYSIVSSSSKEQNNIYWNTSLLKDHFIGGFKFLFPVDWFLFRTQEERVDERTSEYVFMRNDTLESLNVRIYTSTHSKESNAQNKLIQFERLYYDALNLKEKSENDFINKSSDLISANIQFDQNSGMYIIAKQFKKRLISFQIKYEFPEKILNKRLENLLPLFQKIAMSLEESL
jgi:hypothetical protein